MNRTGNIRKFDKKVAEETRTVEFVASDETRDSYGTVVPVAGWDLDRFNKNGVIGYQHNVYGDLCGNEDPDRVIGKGEARIEGKQLIVKITFEPAELNPLAEKIFQKVLFGTLNAVSVGFAETKNGHYGDGDEAQGQKNATYYYGGQELLEVSIVNIPANKNALKRSLRSNTVDAIGFIYKALQGKVRYSEIEKMTVGNVLDLLEGKKSIPEEQPEDLKKEENNAEKREDPADEAGDQQKKEEKKEKEGPKKDPEKEKKETPDGEEDNVKTALAMAEASLALVDEE